MSNRPKATTPWSVRDFAVYGALLGFVLGIVHAFAHAFWSQTVEDHSVGHLLWEITLSVGVGAVLPAAIAVVRNWLMRAQ